MAIPPAEGSIPSNPTYSNAPNTILNIPNNRSLVVWNHGSHFFSLGMSLIVNMAAAYLILFLRLR